MAFVEIKDFKNGLDTRRPAIVGEPGTLTICTNAHITRGGDVESAKSFVLDFVLPAGTFGWHSSRNRLYVFGSGAAPVNLPGQVVYQRLEHPSGSDMTALLFAENNDGKIYAIAEYADGSVYHFYNGARVTDMDAKATSIADDESVAQYLADKVDAQTAFIATATDKDVIITAAVAGTAFTIAQATSGTGSITLTQLQANQAAVAEVRASASFTITGGFAEANNKITSVLAGATELLEDDVLWTLSHTATAGLCAARINQGSGTHGYTATSLGAVVTIQAPEGEGATANGRVLTVTPAGLLTVGSVNNFASGVTAVAAEPQIEKATIGGTFDDANTYQLTLNGDDYLITGLSSGYPRLARTFASKMNTAVRALVIASAVDDPTAVTSGTGINTLNVSSKDQGSQRLTGMGVYQNLLAFFCADTVQIWGYDADPALNTFRQLLPNTGTRSPKAIMPYGNSDLLYLHDSGIRSLRARDSANNAAVDDIGTRIDAEVIAFLATLTDAQIEAAVSVTDPLEGRAWMAIANRIFVFSYFPGGKISAWSWYEPGFTVDGLAVANRRIHVRSGNNIYIYGGSGGAAYPDNGETTVTVQLPFIDAGRIAGEKGVKSLDVVCEGEWDFCLLIDPDDTSKQTTTIHLDGSTCLLGKVTTCAKVPYFAPKLTSTKGGRKTLSSVVVHFDDIRTT